MIAPGFARRASSEKHASSFSTCSMISNAHSTSKAAFGKGKAVTGASAAYPPLSRNRESASLLMSTKNVPAIGNRGCNPAPISSLRRPSPSRTCTTGQVLKRSGPTSLDLRHSASKKPVLTARRSGASSVACAALRAAWRVIWLLLGPGKAVDRTVWQAPLLAPT